MHKLVNLPATCGQFWPSRTHLFRYIVNVGTCLTCKPVRRGSRAFFHHQNVSARRTKKQHGRPMQNLTGASTQTPKQIPLEPIPPICIRKFRTRARVAKQLPATDENEVSHRSRKLSMIFFTGQSCAYMTRRTESHIWWALQRKIPSEFEIDHSQEWSISNFSCSLTRNITSHSMKNLAFHSWLREDDLELPILTTSPTRRSPITKVGRMYFWTWEWKG